MDRTWLLVLLFVFAALPVAPDTAQAQLEETASVQGFVCAQHFEGCWRGLPNATVTLARTDGLLPDERSTATDGGGWFFFDDVPHGSYELTAARTGFRDASVNLTVDGEQGGDEKIDVPMAPLRVEVPLRVHDADGDAVDAEAEWHGERSAGAVEVAGGEAVMELESGFYDLVVRAPGFVQWQQWMLLDGEAVEVTLKQQPPQDASIHGVVRDQDGSPVADAIVEVYQYGGYDHGYEEPRPASSSGSSEDADYAVSEPYYPYYGGSNRTTTGADGSYRIHVYAGDVSITVHKEGHAQRNAYLQVGSGQDLNHDVELLRYPDKTAHVEGRIVGTDGSSLRYVTISLWSPEYGVYECSVEEAQARDGGGSSDGAEPEADTLIAPAPYPHDRGCAITVHPDGTFEGDVTPGYAILEVWHDHWRTCTESGSSDGSLTRTCGPEYLRYSRTLELPADDTTRIDVELARRPGPDATVSGYVVDGETDEAIPGVQVHFSNEETYGWGYAGTDGDGSYKVRVRSGYHFVSVYADGYLPWQGTLRVQPGSDTPLDIVLTPGQASHGYCCYAYDVAYAESSDDSVATGAPAMEPVPADGATRASGDGDADGQSVEDLGGGLGPYDPEARRSAGSAPSDDAPGPGLALLALALLGAALVAIRRR